MEPKLASKKIGKSEEGHLGHPRVTEIHKGASSESFWVHFGFILASFWGHFRTLFRPFLGDLCQPSQIRSKKQLKAARISQQQPATASKSQDKLPGSQYSGGSAGFAERKQFSIVFGKRSSSSKQDLKNLHSSPLPTQSD